MFDSLIGLVAPFNCIRCQREGAPVCNDCLPGIVTSKRSTCFMCNRITEGWRTCQACRFKTKLRGVIVASHYEGHVKELIKKLKYQRAMAVAKTLASLLKEEIDPHQFSLITWAPATSSRMRKRGFNPAALIAKSLAKRTQLAYAETLGRLGQKRQVGTDRRSRLTQLEDKMYAKRRFLIRHAKILVVDDVVTTGATMNECARVLKNAGASYIWGAALAKH